MFFVGNFVPLLLIIITTVAGQVTPNSSFDIPADIKALIFEQAFGEASSPVSLSEAQDEIRLLRNLLKVIAASDSSNDPSRSAQRYDDIEEEKEEEETSAVSFEVSVSGSQQAPVSCSSILGKLIQYIHTYLINKQIRYYELYVTMKSARLFFIH